MLAHAEAPCIARPRPPLPLRRHTRPPPRGSPRSLTGSMTSPACSLQLRSWCPARCQAALSTSTGCPRSPLTCAGPTQPCSWTPTRSSVSASHAARSAWSTTAQAHSRSISADQRGAPARPPTASLAARLARNPTHVAAVPLRPAPPDLDWPCGAPAGDRCWFLVPLIASLLEHGPDVHGGLAGFYAEAKWQRWREHFSAELGARPPPIELPTPTPPTEAACVDLS